MPLKFENTDLSAILPAHHANAAKPDRFLLMLPKTTHRWNPERLHIKQSPSSFVNIWEIKDLCSDDRANTAFRRNLPRRQRLRIVARIALLSRPAYRTRSILCIPN